MVAGETCNAQLEQEDWGFGVGVCPFDIISILSMTATDVARRMMF